MKNVIFYFSGTGNSLYLAKKIASEINDTELIRIAEDLKFGNCDFEKFRDIEYIGIVSPVYALGVPLFVRQFLKNFFSRLKSAGFSHNKYVFIVFNYGGLPGQVLSQIENILKKMSIYLNCSTAIKMPDNYIPAYKIPKNYKIEKILNKADKKISNIITIIKDKKLYRDKHIMPLFMLRFLEWNAQMFYNAFVSISKKQNFAKNFWVNNNCNGCGKSGKSICEKVCPVSNIVLAAERKPVWSDNCTFCLACISLCPNKAIQYKKYTNNKIRYKNPRINLTELEIDR